MTNQLTHHDQPNVSYEYAGFWIRFGALIVDSIVFIIIAFPLLYLIYGATYFDSQEIYLGTADALINWVFPAVASILLWVKFAATPGKMLFRLKVLDEATGNPITVQQAIIRYLGYFVSALALCIGYIWVAFDPKKQGWHDKMAKTVVVKQT